VPVTAKLSQRFYEVLSEDVANELVEWFNAVDLTYRADLRELNELNYARFDAKLEQRLAELRAELRGEMAELRAELCGEMAELRTELHQQMTDLRGELRLQMGDLRTELYGQVSALREENTGLRGDLSRGLADVRAGLVRWMFGFWVTSTLTLGGLIVALHVR
jgi:hypothetical protein